MASPEHLAILEKGVDVWNKWREENPDIEPDLITSQILFFSYFKMCAKYKIIG
jgi:hypothetical protein